MKNYRLVRNYDDAAGSDEEPKKKDSSRPSGHRVSGGTLAKIGVGVGAIALVGLLVYEIFKPKANVSKEFDVTVAIVPPNVTTVGGTVQIDVTVTNNTDKTQNPQLCFDVWPSGHTPNEGAGAWTNMGNILAGESKTLRMPRTLETNWGVGTTILAQVVLYGISGPVWHSTNAFTIVPALTVISVESVTAIHPYIIQASREYAEVEVSGTNKGPSITKYFRLDMKPITNEIGQPYTWVGDTNYFTPITLPAGDFNFTLKPNIPVPTNWGPSSTMTGKFAVKIMIKGDETPWWGDVNGDSQYQLFTIIPKSTLTMTSGESFVESMVPVDRKVSKAGQAISFTMRYTHIGDAGVYNVAVWIKTNEGTYGGYWIGPQAFSVPQSVTSTRYTTVLSGQFKPTALPAGRVIDCLFVFTAPNVVLASPPNTSQVLFANWDSLLTVKA